MLSSTRLVNLIERSADDLSKAWLLDVKKRSSMPTYQAYNETRLYSRVFRVYSQLGRWISRSTDKDEIASQYKALGAERFREGFLLSEVIQALYLTRRHLWLKVIHEGLLDTAIDLYGAMQLNNRVVLFFDRAIYNVVRGYEAEQSG